MTLKRLRLLTLNYITDSDAAYHNKLNFKACLNYTSLTYHSLILRVYLWLLKTRVWPMIPGFQLCSSTKVPARILDQICQVSSQDCGIVLLVLLLGLPIPFNLVVLSSGFFPFPLTFLLVSSCQVILCVQYCLTYPVFQHESIVMLLPLLLQIGLLLLK